MIYLAVDTCVWLELLKVDFAHENNFFDELLFWIENGHIKCVTTQNLIREWDRNKISKREDIIRRFKEKQKEISSVLSATEKLNSVYQPDKVEDALNKRIARVDKLFSTAAIVAKESDEIYLDAVKRNIDCLAPNHSKDSFRDTLNILTLKKHVMDSNYPLCIFTTINHSDFSDLPDKYKLHSHLVQDFRDGKLEYVYFDNALKTFSGKLFDVKLRPFVPSFTDYLKDEKKKEESRILAERKMEKQMKMDVVDDDFISNTQQIDRILLSKKRTKLDNNILEFLFDLNPRYKEYFLKKLAEYGLV
ncbi:PIN domain-containing protein [Chryseobacterium sp. B21-037]|uniref:PIN domain-containing protein n=1 Tax=Chryseobacterium sp. B21-037 TaxID=2926038 RepID=UPI002358861E|nr:PIN domain-containing protein [Chryseobacterium sp. B21-037]MDC8105004.1 PIN domain-containing protein [Chryseobacterium sp. B21-037]